MQRVAFLLRLRPDMIEQYEEAHHHVWPELLAELEALGATDYSIFRHGVQLFLYLRVANWADFLAGLDRSEVNARWQARMAPLLESSTGSIQVMREVFYMKGRSGTS